MYIKKWHVFLSFGLKYMSMKPLFRRRVFELYFAYYISIALTKINNITGNHPPVQIVPLPLCCNKIPLPFCIFFFII